MIGLVALLSCGPKPAAPEGALPPAPRALTPAPASDLVYFVMVDRFANGDPANDGAIDLSDPQAFHGGDLQGVLQKLDYLEALGVGTVWLSPVFEMRTEPFHGWGAFHGYWVRDLTHIEPRFGGDEALRALGDALDARGMRLVLDMVWNHVGFDSPLRETHPHWFHPDRPIEDWDDPVQLETYTVHGLPDLDQDEPEVYQHLLEASLAWGRDAGVDGFRVDAVRHMSSAFLQRISADLHAALGEDFWLLGEDFQGDAGALSRSMQAGGFDAMFDFPLRYALVDVYCHGQAPGRIASILSSDRLYEDPQSLVTFLDNHDLPRVMSECGGDRARVDQALLFQMFTRGTPSVTWGSELYLEGAEEPQNRRDMPWDQADAGASWLAELAALRAEHQPEIGQSSVLQLDDTLLEMVRLRPHEASVLLVNTGAEPRTVALPGALPFSQVLAWRLVGPEGVQRAPPEGLVLREGLTVPPGATLGVVLGVLVSTGNASALQALEAGPVVQEVRVAAEGLAEGERLLLVGSGPELGSWSPDAGVPLVREADGAWVGRFEAPAGLAFAMKLVRVDAEGGVHWQEGGDHYHLTRPGEAASLAWP
ncbi:MAG: glycosyl hydrolase [Alphaproteobacteria bacterium]|nr:glycosyl hydrolase [Alphaproteobacteria bacterium]